MKNLKCVVWQQTTKKIIAL